MRNFGPALSLVAVALTAGCGGHYATLHQQVTNPTGVLAAPLVSLPPLQFVFQPPPDWEAPPVWANHVAQWSEAFAREMERLGGSLDGRTVRLLRPGEVAQQGIVVAAAVRGIERGNAMSGDQILVDVRVLDARTNGPLLTATLRVSSIRYSGGPEGYTFGGRMKFACRNLAEAIVTALRRGEF